MFEKELSLIERAWSENGFLWKVRDGDYDDGAAQSLIESLRQIAPYSSEDPWPPRLLSMIWYIPVFLEWQRDRVRDKDAYYRRAAAVHNEIERLLGIP